MKTLFVNNYFNLNEVAEDHIRTIKPKFGFDGFGEVVFMKAF